MVSGTSFLTSVGRMPSDCKTSAQEVPIVGFAKGGSRRFGVACDQRRAMVGTTSGFGSDPEREQDDGAHHEQHQRQAPSNMPVVAIPVPAP